MKYIVLLVVYFLNLTYHNPKDIKTFEWRSDRPLNRADFQGTPLPKEGGAETFAFLGIKPYKDNVFFTYMVACFDKKKSWAERKDSLGLVHEQAHFDIVEIYARKFNNEFKDLKMLPEEQILSRQRPRMNQILNEMYDTQEQYDKETQHYVNQKEQTGWNNRIRKQLDSIPKIEF